MHLLWGAATVGCLFPFLPRAARLALKARWSRQLLDCLGVRLRAAGAPLDGGLVVANHISWLDIFAINAVAPTAFVSKDDVRHWPLIGWLCDKTETIFMARGSRAAAVRAKEHMADALRRRWRVGIFPEGTTSFGGEVLPFHGALFQAAAETGVRVVPVVLRYTDRVGLPSTAAAYVGDTSLWQCLRTIISASGLTAEVAFLPSLDATAMDRRHLAHRTHTAIAHALAGQITPSRSAPPAGHREADRCGDPQGAPPSGCPPTDSPSPAPAGSAPA